MKKVAQIFAFLLGVIIFFTTAACSSNGGSGSTQEKTASDASTATQPAQTTPIRLGFSPWTGWYVWYLVEEKGFFKEEGVSVELNFFPVYSDSLQALNTGKVDANAQTMSDTLFPASKGLDVRAVLVNDNSYGGDGLVAKPEFKSLQDLKGKTIATELGTVDHFLMTKALDRIAMKETDVNYVNMTVNDAGAAFISGKLDAAVLWEPFLSKAIKEGKGNLLFSSKDVPGLIPDLLVFRGEVVDKRPEDVQKIVNAWFKGVAFMQQHPYEAAEIIAKKAELKTEEYQEMLKSIKLFTLQDNLQAFSPGESYISLQYTAEETAKFLQEKGMLNNIPDVKKILDSSFVQAVEMP
ncbi:MAG: ABC transporter substrate-binding protein [Thermicanus sp.]|nr:ABC transporter substrate-binding protein [Thermicanus sp.]